MHLENFYNNTALILALWEWSLNFKFKTAALSTVQLESLKEVHKAVLASELVESLMLSKHHASPPASARQTQRQLSSRAPSLRGLSCLSLHPRLGSVAPAAFLPVM